MIKRQRPQIEGKVCELAQSLDGNRLKMINKNFSQRLDISKQSVSNAGVALLRRDFAKDDSKPTDIILVNLRVTSRGTDPVYVPWTGPRWS